MGMSFNPFPSHPLGHSTTPEMRVRYWNAYLLFYEAVNSIKKLSLPRRVSGDSPNPTSPLRPHGGEDKLQQLQVSQRSAFNPSLLGIFDSSSNFSFIFLQNSTNYFCVCFTVNLGEIGSRANHLIYSKLCNYLVSFSACLSPLLSPCRHWCRREKRGISLTTRCQLPSSTR